MPLEINTFTTVAPTTVTKEPEVESVCATSEPATHCDSSAMALEQDSDSGKGTQRSESSVASPVSCTAPSIVRKLKRKSKSMSSESEPATDDSGLQTKTAKKHLKSTKETPKKPSDSVKLEINKKPAEKNKKQSLSARKKCPNLPPTKGGKGAVVSNGDRKPRKTVC